MPEVKYAIVFDFADGADPLFAGMAKEKSGLQSFGFARQLETALLYDDEEAAERVRKNAYGKMGVEYGRVVEVPEQESP